MNSKAVGERTEGIILGHLMRIGYSLLIPFGNNQRYDFVVDKGDGVFIKGQCKTATFKNGCVCFWACSTNGFTHKKRGYKGQVEVFWVYCPELDQVFEVPVDSVGETEVSLRVNKPKQRTSPTSRWARDFLLPPITAGNGLVTRLVS